jgi:outer membrane protein OmpU
MGIVGGDRYNNDTQFLQTFDIDMTASGTADNGLSFGASLDLDDAIESGAGSTRSGLSDSRTFSDFTVFISGELGTLTMGDTDGALDWALQEVDLGTPGTIDDAETEHAGFNGNGGLDGHYDGQVLRYDYSFGDFGFAVSVEQDDNESDFLDNLGVGVAQDPNVDGDPVWGLGARYTGAFAGGTFGVGIGYQFNNDALNIANSNVEASVIGVSAHVVLDMGFSAAINYSELDTSVPDGDATHFGLGASYTFDAITLHANYGQYDYGSALGGGEDSGFGFAAAYDFGGGLSAHLGYGYSDFDGGSDADNWSLGLSMSF